MCISKYSISSKIINFDEGNLKTPAKDIKNNKKDIKNNKKDIKNNKKGNFESKLFFFIVKARPYRT